MEVEEDGSLSTRQLYLKPFYDDAKAQLYGPYDYSLIAPIENLSLYLSDETVSVAAVLFGTKFDLRDRRFAVSYWLPCLLFQIVCLPLGLVVFFGSLSPWVAFCTLPGALFPILLLLRSHWRVVRLMLFQWEPMFLSAYSTVFCLSVANIIGWTFQSVFVMAVVLPTLYCSSFSDASSLRLDYAFVKGHISATALALPPYLVSIATLISFLLIIHHSEDQNESLSYRSVALSTGITITLFLLRSIAFLIFDPLRCVSLHAPMRIGIATLTPDTQEVSEGSSPSFAARQSSAINQRVRNLTVSYILTGKIKVTKNDMVQTSTRSILSHRSNVEENSSASFV